MCSATPTAATVYSLRATGEIWERFSSVFSAELTSETYVEAEPASLEIPVDFTKDDVVIVRFGRFISLEIQIYQGFQKTLLLTGAACYHFFIAHSTPMPW